jgi:hypothetical protein
MPTPAPGTICIETAVTNHASQYGQTISDDIASKEPVSGKRGDYSGFAVAGVILVADFVYARRRAKKALG